MITFALFFAPMAMSFIAALDNSGRTKPMRIPVASNGRLNSTKKIKVVKNLIMAIRLNNFIILYLRLYIKFLIQINN